MLPETVVDAAIKSELKGAMAWAADMALTLLL